MLRMMLRHDRSSFVAVRASAKLLSAFSDSFWRCSSCLPGHRDRDLGSDADREARQQGTSRGCTVHVHAGMSLSLPVSGKRIARPVRRSSAIPYRPTNRPVWFGPNGDMDAN